MGFFAYVTASWKETNCWSFQMNSAQEEGRKGTIYFVQHNKNTASALKWAHFSCGHPIALPQRKRSKIKHQSEATKRSEKILKTGITDSKAWVPLSYHLESFSLLLKDNQVSGWGTKKEICNVTRILTMRHDRNIFKTKDRILSKGCFIPMINNSTLMPSQGYMAKGCFLSQTGRKLCLTLKFGSS